jgi:hypothetical protein
MEKLKHNNKKVKPVTHVYAFDENFISNEQISYDEIYEKYDLEELGISPFHSRRSNHISNKESFMKRLFKMFYDGVSHNGIAHGNY